MKPSIQFTNEVQKRVAAGSKYDDAFNFVQMTRPDLVKKMKRAPVIMGDAARSSLTSKLRHQFTNAESALGSTLTAGKFPVPLAAALNIQPEDTPDIVRQKVIQGASGLDSDMLAVLWQTVIEAIKSNVGSVTAAQSKAKSLLPSLLSLCGSPS
jgi:hypothetical protein